MHSVHVNEPLLYIGKILWWVVAIFRYADIGLKVFVEVGPEK
jgi:hypothetical protein